MARKCFYSFHFGEDSRRASQVRQIGALEGNQPVSDNDWEEIIGGGEKAIKNWIKSQMKGRLCTVVLVGEQTAGRKWITHEISESWNSGMGVVAIRIHGLKDPQNGTSSMGGNPLEHVTFTKSGKKLSTVAKCYNPKGTTSKEKYDWISKHLSDAVEEAIRIRNSN